MIVAVGLVMPTIDLVVLYLVVMVMVAKGLVGG
jgi:hypothetical protein